jgi:hypothetical protein
MAQAAHAATAVLVKHRDDSKVQSYEADLADMRKVSLCECGRRFLADKLIMFHTFPFR